MATTSTSDALQGELERLFDLDAMLRLSSAVLGFDPAHIGGIGSKGTFARALVQHCATQDALAALVDAILLSSDRADTGLKKSLRGAGNAELAPGTNVAGMRIVKKIGEGGLSVVYLAEGEAGRVALKVIRPEYARDRAAVHRFTTVSRILQTLQAPGVASILGVGQLEDARPWVAAEYFPGQTLADRIKRTGSMHINEVRPILTGVLRGLAALHERGLVHGDVKVENVFILRPAHDDGARVEPTGVLVDVAADRLLTRTDVGAGMTGLLAVLGTAKALAPEQARGVEPDARTDIYQMGTLMYEALTGRPPFVGDSAIDVIAQHLATVPEPPSARARKGWVLDALDELVLRALAKDPDDRFQSAKAMLDALDAVAGRPVARKPLDEPAFAEASRALVARPHEEALADAIESQARESDAWERAVAAIAQAAHGARELEVKLSLLFRVARIYDTELKDARRAEAAYHQILELQPDSEVALRGLEATKRAAGDHEGLLGVLLDRIDREQNAESRRALLHEVAGLYEKKLNSVDNALVAWTQALLGDPTDEKAQSEIERLCDKNEARWGEVLGTLSQSAQEAHGALLGDEGAQREAARAALAQAQANHAEVRAAVDANMDARREERRSASAEAARHLEAAEAANEASQGEVIELEEKFEAAARQMEEHANAAREKREAAAQAHARAEQTVEAYEALEREVGENPSESQQEELAKIAAEAESLVEGASQTEAEADALDATVEEARAGLAQAQAALDASQERARVAGEQLEVARAAAGGDGATAVMTDEERAALAGAEQALAAAQADFDRLTGDEEERRVQRERDQANVVRTYVLMGHWYAERVNRPDFALSCYSQALSVDATDDAAYDGVIDLYRASQSWSELAQALLQRAERSKSPPRARDYRAEAGVLIARKLNDVAQARALFERVLADDPAHAVAQEALGEILKERGEWEPLAALLERRSEGQSGADKAKTLLRLGELYEDHLEDLDRAAAKYSAVVGLDTRDLTALKGLERIHSRKGNFDGLLGNLRAQVELAATPKQRITLLERIGLIQEEEFVDYAGAAQSFEDIIAIDAGNEAANAALVRLYRHLQRFEDVVEALDRHAAASDDERRKVDLLLQAGRVLTVEVGSPERAIEMYERVLAVDPEHNAALDEVARLRSTAGDLSAALEAVERLAQKEQDPKKRADLWVRAGRILQDGGDRDGAIERYKRALDIDKEAGDAAEALRGIYSQRGDDHGAAEMLQHAIEIADGDRRRAELLGELGVLYRDRMADLEEAESAFEKAFALDATCTVAAAGLGRIAFENKNYRAAIDYLEPVLGRLDELPNEEAAEVCTSAARAFQELEQGERALDALKRARDLMSGSLPHNERYAAALLRSGKAREAERLYATMYDKFEERLDVADKVRLLLARADAQIGAEHPRDAVATVRKGLELRPEDPELLAALTRCHEATKDWNEVVNLLQLRARRATDAEQRFELLAKTGDVFLERLKDRDAAAQTYVMALDVKPDSRNLLTKLMSVYSDAKDWPRLIEIILRIAEMVNDAAQVAKYYTTAASIAQVELHRFDEAANYFEHALARLSPDGGQVQFDALVQCLTENQDWDRLERAYETRIERLRGAKAEPKIIASALDARGAVLQHKLGRLVDALQWYEEALELDPDNAERREMLAALYTKEPKRFFREAVRAHRHYLARDPYRVESLRALRKIYTSGKKPDESWCLCQALRCLKMADVDEEKFYKKYRLSRLPKVKQAASEDTWRQLIVHPTQDAIVTAIFATVQPAVIAAQSQKLATFGVGKKDKIDTTSDAVAMGRMLDHVAQTLNLPLPDVYQNPQDAGGLSFLFTVPPAVGVGQGAMAGGPQQALAYVAARHMAYYRPGHYMRQLVPTGTGLRAWLMAAIRMVAPKFPVPVNLDAQVKEHVAAIRQHLQGPHIDQLRSLTQKLLEAAPELDMKGWMAGVDLSADRAGLVLCNDLKVANAVVEASPEEAASIARKDRLRELLVYSTSDNYFELRKRMGISLGS